MPRDHEAGFAPAAKRARGAAVPRDHEAGFAPAAKCARGAAVPRDHEAGFALVEVIVSAAVLALVALAVLAGVDAAGRSTGREKARAVAVTLAEQDQERMRGIAARDVTAVTDLGPYTVNGAQYTVDSSAEWVDDATGGTDSCSNSGSKASYIRITSVVTSAGLGSTQIKIASLVEPPLSTAGAGEGYLAVQVTDHTGTGVPGVSVHAAGPTTDDITTNDAGCAVFGRVGVGSYDFTLNKTGYVDVFGRSPGQLQKVSVTQDAKTVAAVKFDAAAPLTLAFETSNPTTGATISGSTAYWLSAADSEAPALLTYGDGSTAITSTVVNLFPFTTPYSSVYAGKCVNEDPLTVVGSSYYGTYQGTFAATPGTPGSRVIHQPPLRLRFQRSSSDVAGATLLVTGPCDTSSDPEQYTMSTTSTANGPGGVAGWPTRTATGPYDPGLPYGAYKVCAKKDFGGFTGVRYATATATLSDPKWGPPQATPTTVVGSWSPSQPSSPDCP